MVDLEVRLLATLAASDAVEIRVAPPPTGTAGQTIRPTKRQCISFNSSGMGAYH
jgi:hypothetical protein